MKELSELANLQTLELNTTQVTNQGLKELVRLNNLRTLDLGFAKVTDAGLRDLALLKNLQELDLPRTQVTDAGMKELVGLENLRLLNVRASKVTDAGLKVVAQLKNLRALKPGIRQNNRRRVEELGTAQELAIAETRGDEPRISISDVSKYEGKKNQTTLFTFTVTLSAAYDQAVTVSFRTVDGTATTADHDYVAQTGTLTFAPGQTTKTITIVVNGDNKKEADETFFVDLFGKSSNSLFTKNRGIGMILNDD